MKKTSTLFLKGIILLVAGGVLVGLLWFPQTEGRAAHLDLVSIYSDPFIIYIYIASTLFFAGLYQAFKFLTLIDENKAISENAVLTLKHMKIASLWLIGFIMLAGLYLRFFVHGDDLAGPSMLGILMILAFSVIATATGIFQKLLQNALDMKSENELTV